jgi:hypothetical protein
VEPHIISKTLLGKTGMFTLQLTVNFKAVRLGDKPLEVFLTTAGGISSNTICSIRSVHVQPEQRDIFGPTRGQTASIRPGNGQITSSNLQLSIAANASQAQCPNNSTLYVNSVILKNVELHILQNDGFEVLTFNFGDLSLPTESLPTELLEP